MLNKNTLARGVCLQHDNHRLHYQCVKLKIDNTNMRDEVEELRGEVEKLRSQNEYMREELCEKSVECCSLM